MQGCTTSITLGAASGVKLSGDPTRTHTYIYMSHTQIKKNIKYTKTTAVRDWKLVTSCGQSQLRICNISPTNHCAVHVLRN